MKNTMKIGMVALACLMISKVWAVEVLSDRTYYFNGAQGESREVKEEDIKKNPSDQRIMDSISAQLSQPQS